MNGETYRKVMKGKRTTYELVKPLGEGMTTLNLSTEECLTAAGALGYTLMSIFERNMPKMRNGTPGLAERKITAVRDAILDLYKGTGKPIDDSIALLFFTTWDQTMAAVGEKGVTNL